jgi:hypothetical protein
LGERFGEGREIGAAASTFEGKYGHPKAFLGSVTIYGLKPLGRCDSRRSLDAITFEQAHYPFGEIGGRQAARQTRPLPLAKSVRYTSRRLRRFVNHDR